jgi:hypothetical protein
MTETPPPAPLELTREEFSRVRDYIDDHGDESEPNQRLLIEILDCLRRIDDKLGRLLERSVERPDR